MADIGSIGANFAAPVAPVVAVPVQESKPATVPSNEQLIAEAVTAVPAAPTNANINTQGTYTALASASTSNIRGVSLNTSA